MQIYSNQTVIVLLRIAYILKHLITKQNSNESIKY